jgi:hypothetical protein
MKGLMNMEVLPALQKDSNSTGYNHRTVVLTAGLGESTFGKNSGI